MTRIEAGLVLINVEFSSSRFAYTDHDRVTPKELGFGWMLKGIDDDDRPFIGRDAIRRELADKTSRWATVGLVARLGRLRPGLQRGRPDPAEGRDAAGLRVDAVRRRRRADRLRHQPDVLARCSSATSRWPGSGRTSPRAGTRGQPRAHHQPPLRDGRGRRSPGSRSSTHRERRPDHGIDGQELRRDRRRRRAQRARQRRLPRQGRPQGAHPRAPPPRRRRRDHRGAAPGLPLHVVLLRAEPAAAGHRPGARPGQARLHADPDAVVLRADGERRLPAARPGPRREHQGDHAALVARRRRDGPLRVRRRAGLPGRQAAARQGPAEHLRQVAGGPRRRPPSWSSTSAVSTRR